jgi:hypothetical protein
MGNIGDTISMASLKNKPPEKRTKEEEEERERSRRLFGTKDFTMVNRSADVIFDAAWSLMKNERDDRNLRDEYKSDPKYPIQMGIEQTIRDLTVEPALSGYLLGRYNEMSQEEKDKMTQEDLDNFVQDLMDAYIFNNPVLRPPFGAKFDQMKYASEDRFDAVWDMMAKMRQLQGDTRMINQLRGKQGTLQQYKDQSQNLRDELKQIDLNTQRQEYMDKLDEVNNLNRQKSDFIESLGRE